MFLFYPCWFTFSLLGTMPHTYIILYDVRLESHVSLYEDKNLINIRRY